MTIGDNHKANYLLKLHIWNNIWITTVFHLIWCLGQVPERLS